MSDRFSQRYLTVNLTPINSDRLIKVHNLGALRGIYQQINQECCEESTLQYRRSHFFREFDVCFQRSRCTIKIIEKGK
ncbi:hypothetical protein LC605_17770 [Nostoc sp. CHAB 5836]|uniref:hypothetical protein n=1 Tax=Nostoc sp. CHAB 5836 TaxID=2780404 RepID=UPI001E3943D0|nr:hypothetical protein [Nostoc sp. CHAB 5836]MCC5616890.1 hypothetical protein [Nostoc sp. CHAB 5836]